MALSFCKPGVRKAAFWLIVRPINGSICPPTSPPIGVYYSIQHPSTHFQSLSPLSLYSPPSPPFPLFSGRRPCSFYTVFPPLRSTVGGVGIKLSVSTFHTVDPPSSNVPDRSPTVPPQVHSPNAVVLRQKIPPNFIADTYLPHVEDQIAYHTHMLTPAQLTPLVSAYAALPAALRHKTLASKLSESIKNRITAFRASECVQILYPMYKMLPGDIDLFRVIADHMLAPHIFSEVTTLQLIGMVRVYSKLQKKVDGFLDTILPRLQKELAAYDSVELCDILASIATYAHHSDTIKDAELLSVIIPEIESKYSVTSLLHTISNLNSLCKLKIYHEGLMQRATKDFSNGLRIRNLPPKYIARLCWVYARYGKLSLIAPSLFPLIESNIDRFSPIDFGKLSQALPEGSNVLLRICQTLIPQLSEFSRNEFSVFFLGSVRRGFFPLENGGIPQPTEFDVPASEKELFSDLSDALVTDLDRQDLLDRCLGYLQVEDQNFRENECFRIIYLLKASEHYKYILNRLPASWSDQINEVTLESHASK